jgi:hypothetical protein
MGVNLRIGCFEFFDPQRPLEITKGHGAIWTFFDLWPFFGLGVGPEV